MDPNNPKSENPPPYGTPQPGYDQPPPQPYRQPSPQPYGQPSPQPYPQPSPQPYGQPYPQPNPYVQPAPGSTVVVVNQPYVQQRNGLSDYMMPKALVPGILMIIVGVINLAALIFLSVFRFFSSEFLFAFAFYLVCGILAVIGARRPQRSSGVGIGCIVMASLSLSMSFSQMCIRLVAITVGEIFTTGQLRETLLVVFVVLLILSLLAMALSIALIVIPSKVVCSCCRPQQRGAVYQPSQPQQMQPTAAGY